MAKPRVTLYFDIVSPFSYEAYYILRDDPIFSQCKVTYVPVLLAGIMKACGNLPPTKVKNKSTYVAKQRLHFATHYHIPIASTVPPGFPHFTLSVMRALVALTHLHPPSSSPENERKYLEATDALFSAYHVDHRSAMTSDPAVLEEVMTKAIGREDARKVVEMSGQEGAKKGLEGTGEMAMKEGAFGLPWMVAEKDGGEERVKEGFWGVETMERMVGWLCLEGKLRGGEGREKL